MKARLGELARRHGFDRVGIVAPDAIPQVGDRLAAFLADGAQGDMDWLARAPERRADPGVLIERPAKIGVESFDPCDVATTNVVAGPARHSSTPTTVRNWALAVCGEAARIAAKAPKRYEERVIARAVPMEGRRDRPRNSPSAAIAFENGIGQARQTDSHM